MLNYEATATSPASPAVVWRLLVDARTWPVWSTVDSLVTERSSGLDPTSGGGTVIHWHGSYSARWGMGWSMKGVMQRMADGLASRAAAQ